MADGDERAGPGPDGRSEEADERVRTTATHLFAELGYDAVSTQMIADAADVTVDTVTDRHGGRHGLYLSAFEEVARQIDEYLEEVGEDFAPDAEGLFRMIDRYLRLCLENPEVPRLWFHRWMSDASDITGLEEEIGAPAQQTGFELFTRVIKPELDPEAHMWTLVWSVHAYMLSGYPDASSRRRPPDDPETLQRFRRHLRRLTRLMVTP
ncbi:MULTISPECIES: TetR/AcrR family transcriptional regulator [Actinomadura]|uniref:TetR/AcrR family transcriptional regulator n=1 Tax=Actinomadura TaxID=1988 RepID=UPI000F781713|nr:MULTISPECIES: TetR family transcriptional regulator [Actinomadura]